MDFSRRIAVLRDWLDSQDVSGAIISNTHDIQYYTGVVLNPPIHREAYLFVGPRHSLFYHSPFLQPELPSEMTSLPMSPQAQLNARVRKLFDTLDTAILGIQGDDLKLAEFNKLSTSLKPIVLKELHARLASLRMTKESAEIKHIRTACQITAQTMEWACDQCASGTWIGVRERDIARAIEQHYFELGAHEPAFPTIVAVGLHSALPHHIPGDTTLGENTSLLLDFGCRVAGYASDMTKTIHCGEPSKLFDTLEQTVLNAYKSALRTAKVGASVDAVDRAARGIISRAGYGHEYIHTTGHGLGLSIHEPPSIRLGNDMILAPNMVITIEPGIYIPGKQGYRHEHTVLITEKGPEVLTKAD